MLSCQEYFGAYINKYQSQANDKKDSASFRLFQGLMNSRINGYPPEPAESKIQHQSQKVECEEITPGNQSAYFTNQTVLL